MPLAPREIRRSPSPQEEDDGEEWPVYGIVGEDVDVFGNSMYVFGPQYFFTSKVTSPMLTAMRQARALPPYLYPLPECRFLSMLQGPMAELESS